MMMRDADFGIVRLRAYGTYDFHVVDVEEIPEGSRRHRRSFPARRIRRHDALTRSSACSPTRSPTRRVPALDVAARYTELGEALLPLINPAIGEKYGLEMTSFVVENVSVPPEVEQAIDKRSSMAAVGNLNDYVKFQMAQGMEKGGNGGVGGIGAEMAVGMAMAQQMINQTGGIMAQGTPGIPAPAPAAAAAAPDLMTPGQVAQALGVGESDVMASLESGDLKGKKIGTQWRVTRAAVDAFLQS